MTWNDERVAELTELWGAGKTAKEIAAVMGLTKNAVIGKADRLSLERRPSPIKLKPRLVDISKPFPPTAQPHEPTGCRWIDGDVQSDDWRFCQAAQKQGSAYCRHHHERCYRRVDLSRRTDLAIAVSEAAE